MPANGDDKCPIEDKLPFAVTTVKSNDDNTILQKQERWQDNVLLFEETDPMYSRKSQNLLKST